MALIKCPECAKDVSDTATCCPHCGYKLSRQKNIETMKKTLAHSKNTIKSIKSSRKFKTIFFIIASVLALLVLIVSCFMSPLFLILLLEIGFNVLSWFVAYRWVEKEWFFWVTLILTGTLIIMDVSFLFGLDPPDIKTCLFCSFLLVSIAFVIKLSLKKSRYESDTFVTPHFEKTIIDVHICNRCGEIYLKERPRLCSKCNNSVMKTVKVETINDGELTVVTCLDCQQKSFNKTDKCQSCGSSNIITEYRKF